MKKEKSCGCIVFDDKMKVLLVKMRQGHWSFPKGHVEKNETEYETAYREVKEETNIECNIINGFRQVSTYSPYDGIIKDVVFFVAKNTSSNIVVQEEELTESAFYCIDIAKNLLTFDSDKTVLKKAVQFMNSIG